MIFATITIASLILGFIALCIFGLPSENYSAWQECSRMHRENRELARRFAQFNQRQRDTKRHLRKCRRHFVVRNQEARRLSKKEAA